MKLEIKAPILRKHIGKKVRYILKSTYWGSHTATIDDVIGRNVSFSGNFIYFTDIISIELIDE